MNMNQTLVNEICPTTTQGWVKRGALLVDVREKNEVELLAYDVPNIVNIPLSEFDIRYKELAMDMELVIVCRAGVRSLRATGFLINHGFDPVKVVNMKHGIIRWVQRGFPTRGDVSSVADSGAGNSCCETPVKTKNEKNSCCNSTDKNGSGCC